MAGRPSLHGPADIVVEPFVTGFERPERGLGTNAGESGRYPCQQSANSSPSKLVSAALYALEVKTVVLGDPPHILGSLISERQNLGLDTHDELWVGEYHMAPAANFEHGRVGARLIRILDPLAAAAQLELSLEFNLGSSTDFRVPDLGLHRGSPAGTWIDTAAIVVEVRSPDDETFEKFGFYFERGVDEVLVADLVERAVTWFVRGADSYVPAAMSDLLSTNSIDLQTALGW
jgi:Putative restriction endonuclease